MSKYHAAQDILELVERKLVDLGICEECYKKVYDLIEKVKSQIVDQKLERVGEDFLIFP